MSYACSVEAKQYFTNNAKQSEFFPESLHHYTLAELEDVLHWDWVWSACVD